MNKENAVVRKWLKKYFIRSLKIAGWFLVSLTFLLASLILIVRIPSVQNKVVQKAISFLEEKIGTDVSLSRITISFPKKIVVEELFLLDQAGDTLLYAGQLDIDVNFLELLKREILFNRIEFTTFRGSINRPALDSTFNFEYIIKAFSSDDGKADQPADSTSRPWLVSINEVTLKNTYLSYHDAYGGNMVDLRIGDADVRMDEFDLEKSIFRFDVIRLVDINTQVEQESKLPAPFEKDINSEAPAAFPYDIGFRKVDLKNIKAEYAQITSGERLSLDLGEAQLEADRIDWGNRIIRLESFELANTLVSYQQLKRDEQKRSTPEDTVRVTTFDIPWSLGLHSLTFVNNSIQYYNFNEAMQEEAMDFNHLWIHALNVQAKDLMIENQTAKVDLRSLSLKEKNGFEIRSLSAKAALEEKEINIENLLFKTKHSKIETNARARFESLGSLVENYSNAQIEVNINHSVASLGDILLFYPAIADSLPLKLSPSTFLSINADAHGTPNDLTIRSLHLKTLDSTVLETKGTIKGLTDLDRATLNLEIERFHTTRTDMNRLLADSLLPSSIEIPRWVNVKGTLEWELQTSKFSALLTSSSGTIQAEGRIDLNGSKNYDAKLKTEALDMGQILKQKEKIGKLNLEGKLSGAGLTMEELDAQFDVRISSFEYKQYAYEDFTLNGTMKKYLFSGTALLHDKNLDFTLKGDLDYGDSTPRYKASFDLRNMDLKALHLSEKPIRARGKLEVDLATSDFKVVNGRIDIRKVAVFNGADLYVVDSLLYVSIDQQGQSEITIRSDILSGDFKGTINLFAMPDAVRQHVNQYFSYRTDSKKPTDSQNFSFNLIIKNTDLLTEIILPELEPFKPGEIKGEFSSLENKLDLRIKVSKLKYARAGVDSLVILVDSDKDALSYSFAVKNFVADTLQIDELTLKGRIAHDSIHSSFRILDYAGEKEKYILGGVLTSRQDRFRFHFVPGQVILNSSEWEVPKDNFLDFGDGNLHANHFDISKGSQKIALLTSANADSVISIVFSQLELGNLTRMVGGVVPASGELNGDLKFTTTKRGQFNSSLRITDMTVLQKGWGDVSFLMNYVGGKYEVDLKVKGNNTNMSAKGSYSVIQESPSVNLTATLAPFNLELLEPWSFGHLQRVSGIVQGNLTIQGKPTTPSILGELTFKDANFIATYLNNQFTLKNETISFREAGIVLSNFTVLDYQDNAATFSGSINTTAYKEFDLNLNVGAKDFQVLNTTQESNAVYYGRMKINLTARVTGTAVEPKVVINAALSDDSNVTYVVPQQERAVLEQEGIVKFVDKDALNDPFLASIKSVDTLQSKFSGVDLSATIKLSGKETLNIVIDPIAGDKLSVHGYANLIFDLDPSGNMDLAGRYEISKGSYDLSFYKLVKRKFEIQSGSSLTWAGDPLNASMDIRASHLVETSPIDLISNQMSADESMASQYRQRLPFLVYLIIRGELLRPQISFSLDMPMEKRNPLIYAKLQDINTRESDLNKQVFALLILRRFVSENPLESQAGDLSNTTRTSVSRLLSEQLNRLSENVKGVQLSFDVKSYEDYSTGAAQGRTQAQLGVSKSLLHDRLVVKLSGNVDIEGENANQDEVTDYIGDLALEYKMTPDGRFRVTGFRNSNYDMIDGELIETGAGLLYIKDYNTLRELFKANEKEK